MAHIKVCTWGHTGGTNFCPLKPMEWLQRAETFPYTQKEESLCILTLGGGRDFNKKMFLMLSSPL
eukprot:3554497-Ditylum_brightwellii.AAC.2